MRAMPTPNQAESNILYDLYQKLPIGVVLLDPCMKILSANRKFRIYFPFHPEGPEGFLLCDAMGCRYTERETCDDPKGCKNCPLVRNVGNMIRNNVPMEAVEIRHQPLKQYRRKTQWFRVNGIPADCSYGRYGILFFDDVTDHMKKEKALREKLEVDLSTKVLNNYGLMKYLDSMLQAEKTKPVAACMMTLTISRKLTTSTAI